MHNNKDGKKRGEGPRVLRLVSEESSEKAGADQVKKAAAMADTQSEATSNFYVDWDRVGELFAELILASLSKEDNTLPELRKDTIIEVRSFPNVTNSNKKSGEQLWKR